MTTIRATCPACGEIDLDPADVVLLVARDDAQLLTPDSRYEFVCPSCHVVVSKPADERIVSLLASGGVRIRSVPGPGSTAPALTYDDLLDFHLLLATEDWFDELVALTGS